MPRDVLRSRTDEFKDRCLGGRHCKVLLVTVSIITPKLQIVFWAQPVCSFTVRNWVPWQPLLRASQGRVIFVILGQF